VCASLPSTAKSTKKSPTPPSLPSRRRRSTTVAGPEICCRHSQVDALQHCFSWSHADRATGKRATTVLAELAKNGNSPKPSPTGPIRAHPFRRRY
jgi:hypothetical protein